MAMPYMFRRNAGNEVYQVSKNDNLAVARKGGGVIMKPGRRGYNHAKTTKKTDHLTCPEHSS